jgi:aminoglycoside phosphotransferase
MSSLAPVATAMTIESLDVPTLEPPNEIADFGAQVRELLPDFVAEGSPLAARKSELLPGTVNGRAVIAKRSKKPNVVWDWYLEHEIAMYRMFSAHPPRLRTPHLVAAGPGLLVIERVTGEPLASKRRPAAALPIRTIGALIAAHDQFGEYATKIITPLSPVRQMRERLLEDPSDPSWIRDGVRLCGRRGLLDEELARNIDTALSSAPLAPNHGDLMLRNVIGDDEEDVTLVDWECSGIHLRDWDLALLWTQLAGPARGIVEDAVRENASRWRQFLGLVAFACAREIKFLDSFPNGALARPSVVAELAEVAERFTKA